MTENQIPEEYKDKISEIAEKMMAKKHAEDVAKRRGVRVFCVSCGAGNRIPILEIQLRKWHNSYICQNCWKMLQMIGEEAFISKIKEGAENGSN